MADFDIAIKKTLANEGGYSDDLLDSGGKTRFGISQKSYPDEDIQNLTLDRAKFLYRRDFWDKINGDKLNNQLIAESIFDTAVNMGVKTAVVLTQRALKVKDDGILGINTTNALNALNVIGCFLNSFAVVKIDRYCDIVDKNPTQLKYLKGWIRRTLDMVT